MKIAIIGSGHVGLVTGACFADLGNEVICMDDDKKKVQLLRAGKIPFYEPGLSELVRKNRAQNRLRFTSHVGEAVRFAKVIFLCVGTPPREDGEADLSAVEHVTREIAANLTDYRLIVEKSTVPVETGAQLTQMIRENSRKKVSFDVASNAEFLREGSAVQDFFSPDRIIIGVDNKRAERLLLALYQPLHVPVFVTDIRSAELIKHAANSFLAMKISFINWVGQICERVGADVTQVAEGLGHDRRIGTSFLNAGIGFGGSCFPKDLAAFTQIGEKLNIPSNLLKEVRLINERQKINFVQKVQKALSGLNGKKVGVLGLSFKPNTDDMRFASSVDILTKLKSEGVRMRAYDPKAMGEARKILTGIEFAKNAYDACRGADAALILTEWREFCELDLKRLKRFLKRPVVIDGRNIYDPKLMAKLGFRYFSIGR